MGRGNKLITALLLIALLFATGGFVGDKAAAPETRSEKTLTSGEVQLIFSLMDTNKDGKYPSKSGRILWGRCSTGWTQGRPERLPLRNCHN